MSIAPSVVTGFIAQVRRQNSYEARYRRGLSSGRGDRSRRFPRSGRAAHATEVIGRVFGHDEGTEDEERRSESFPPTPASSRPRLQVTPIAEGVSLAVLAAVLFGI